MEGQVEDTRSRILAEAAALAREGGAAALTFDAVAARLGVSKQAVLYWFPTKGALLTGLALPFLRAEAQAVADGLEGLAQTAGAPGPAEVARAVVPALIRFHLADLARFRLMYVASQIGQRGRERDNSVQSELASQIHPVTAAMYGAIAGHLGGSDPQQTRRCAVALHMAALGHVLLVALAESIGDPLRHSPELLAESMAEMLAQGTAAALGPIASRTRE